MNVATPQTARRGSAVGNALALARRELGFYFNSPIGYITITLFLLLCGTYLFAIDDPSGKSFFEANEASLRKLMGTIPLFFVFLIPAITMRLISEEKRSGTIELLVTMPITDMQITVGKYLGGLAFLAITLITTLPLPILVSTMGSLDWGVVVGGYVGLFLVGSAYLAIGLMTSAWTKNQILAYLGAALICGFFYFVGDMVESVWTGAQDAMAFISFKAHFTNVARGVIDSRDLIFYLSIIGIALTVTAQSLQSRNWK